MQKLYMKKPKIKTFNVSHRNKQNLKNKLLKNIICTSTMSFSTTNKSHKKLANRKYYKFLSTKKNEEKYKILKEFSFMVSF